LNPRLRNDWLLLTGFCLFLFFYGLGSFGLLGADEPRYAQVAREMLQRHDWITPTLGGQPWLEKPVLYYWQAEIAYAIFGVHDWAARVPSAFDASWMVFAAYWFLRKRRAPVALDGALMVASAAGIVGFAHSAATDMPLAAMFTISMLAWYAWWETQEKSSLAAFYVFLALATLAKGPVAPFLAVVIIALFALASGRAKVLLQTLWIPGILLFAAVALPWYIAVQIRNPEFFRVFILEHNLARFGTNLYRHKQPFWFFVPVALLTLLPWVIFVLAAGWETGRGWWRERRAMFDSGDALSVYLLIWLLVPVIFFSLSQSKLPGYILPALAAGPLLVAEYLRRRLPEEGGESEKPSAAMASLHGVLAVLPFVSAVFAPYFVVKRPVPLTPGAIVTGLLAFSIALAIGYTLKTMGIRVLRTVTLVPVVLAVAVIIKLDATTLNTYLSAQPVAAELDRLESHPFPLAVYGVKRDTEYGLGFYRNQVIQPYAEGQIPSAEHLLVTARDQQSALAKLLGHRGVQFLGSYNAQALDFYRVSEKE